MSDYKLIDFERRGRIHRTSDSSFTLEVSPMSTMRRIYDAVKDIEDIAVIHPYHRHCNILLKDDADYDTVTIAVMDIVDRELGIED